MGQQDFQQRMTLLKIALIFLISTTAISAAPREVRSYNPCGASWLKLKCSDCSSSGQQCNEWTLQQCMKCNLGPKAALNNHNDGHAGLVANHHNGGNLTNGANQSLNKDNNIIEGNNNNGGFLNHNTANNNMGGNNQSGNNNTGDNNGSTNSGNTNSGNTNSANTNSGNTNSGNGSNNKGNNNGNTITNSNNRNTIVHFNIS